VCVASAVCCSGLQCVAVDCSVLQACLSRMCWCVDHSSVYVCVASAVCCSMLQSVAECCRVLQCVAVCRSVLTCVAVCFVLCLVLYCVAVISRWNTRLQSSAPWICVT